jgi:hypothetical protein
VFEWILLEVSQMDPSAWAGVRAELEATALVRVETDIEITNRPYLRFHPTLPYAVGGVVLADATASQANADNGGLGLATQEDVRQRFIAVYSELTVAIGRALNGSAVRGGMDVLAREEANVRTAALGSGIGPIRRRCPDGKYVPRLSGTLSPVARARPMVGLAG